MEEGGQGFKKEGETGSLMALTPGLKRAPAVSAMNARLNGAVKRRLMTGGSHLS